MLSEGWDAKSVTHIMGLRAFSSQLLCEQVVGRGLRRVTYEINNETGLFNPEYVNIFGIPFTFLPHEGGENIQLDSPKLATKIEPDKKKQKHEIIFPNIDRIEHTLKPELSLNMDNVPYLELDPYENVTSAEMAAILNGKPSMMDLTEIDLNEIGEKIRLQTIIFETAKRIYQSEQPLWKGNKELLLIQLIKIIEKFVLSDKITVIQNLFAAEEVKKRLLLILNMNKIVHHIWQAIHFENNDTIVPVFNIVKPNRSTSEMPVWYTTKPCQHTKKSHVNFCILDSTWESTEAYHLDKHPNVVSWVKNDHLGFEVSYNYQGVIHKYRPDFIVKMKSGVMLVLETKGKVDELSKTKQKYLEEWIKAVNNHGGYGIWASAMSKHPSDVESILNRF